MSLFYMLIKLPDKETLQKWLMDLVPLYKTSFYIIIAVLVFVLENKRHQKYGQYFIDPNKKAVDCNNIKVRSVVAESNRIYVNLIAEDFIEYPRLVAPQLIEVIVETPISDTTYKMKQFWDLEESGPNISFCILQTVSGRATTKIYCQKNLLSDFVVDVPEITIFPIGWSRIVSNEESPAVLNDFCVDQNEDIVYLSPPDMNLKPITVGSSEFISMTTNHTSLQYFLTENRKYTLFEDPVIFAASQNPDSCYMLIDIILPIWQAVVSDPDQHAKIRTLRFDQKANEAIARVGQKYLLPNKPQCYKQAAFLNNIGSVPYNQPKPDGDEISHNIASIERFMSMPGHILRSFRDAYVRVAMVPGRIVLDRMVYDTYGATVKRLFPECEVLPLDHDITVPKIADLVGSANVYICAHISTAVFAIFLHEEATVIEQRQRDAECFSFAGDVVQHTGAHYIQIGHKELCACENLREYFKLEMTYQPLTDDMLRDAIQNALDSDYMRMA